MTGPVNDGPPESDAYYGDPTIRYCPTHPEYRYVWEETAKRGNVTVTVLSKTPLKNPRPVTPNPKAAEAINLFGSQKGENK